MYIQGKCDRFLSDPVNVFIEAVIFLVGVLERIVMLNFELSDPENTISIIFESIFSEFQTILSYIFY